MCYPSGLFLLFLLVFSSWNGFGQTSGDSLFAKAKEAFRQQEFEKAYQGFEEASQHFLDQELYDRYVEALLQKARMTQFTKKVSMSAIPSIVEPIALLLEEGKIERNHLNTTSYYTILGFYHERVSGNFSEALSLFDLGLAVCTEVGTSADTQKLMMTIEISRVHLIQERFDLAMDFAETAFDLSIQLLGKNHNNSANAYYHLAHVYYKAGRYDQAEALLLEGIKILQDIDAPEIQLGLGYQNLFTTDVARLDLKSARANADRAIEIYRKYLGDGHETIGTIFRDLGVKHLFLSQPDSAIHYLIKAMKIYTDRFGWTYPELHLIYHNLGNAYTANQQFELATTYHLKGLEVQNTASREILSYVNLAHNFIESGQFQEAQIYLDRSEQMVKDSLFENSIHISRLYHTKGLFYYHRDSFLQAARSWHRSLLELNRTKRKIPISASLPVDSFLNLVYGVEHAVHKSRALYDHYQTTGRRSDLDLAMRVMESADELMEKLRSSYRNSESKIFLQKKGRNHYENILDASFAGYAITRDPKFLETGWQAMEKSRSLLLMEALKSHSIDGLGVPDHLIQSNRYLQDDLANLEERYLRAVAGGDSVLQKELLSNYFERSDSLKRVQNEISVHYPQYFQLTTKLSPISISAIQSQLESDKCVIEFFWGEKQLYRMIVARDTLFFDRLAETDIIEQSLDQWVKQMQSLEFLDKDLKISTDSINSVSKILFDHLLADCYEQLASYPDLIIVPDQKLGFLSFEALRIRESSDEQDRYLIRDHTISYAYSASHFAALEKDHSTLRLGRFVGFAPSYDVPTTDWTKGDNSMQLLTRAGYSKLPGARDEVNSIHSIVGGDKFLGDQATEYLFKSNVHDYGLVHLALHGLISDGDPLFSRLIFDQNDTIEDGYLHTYEIFNLPLKADLVVLSACNTGLGRIEKGEGIMSLSRAFAYAGAPFMIASLWKVEDQAAKQLMITFYEKLISDQPMATALRSAKLDYLANQKSDLLKHPYFWSSFVFYSQNSVPNTTTNLGILAAGVVMLLLLVFWIFKSR